MVISGPFMGYVWLFVCGASYLTLLLGVVALEWYEERFPHDDSKQVISGARWMAAVFAFFLIPALIQTVVMIETEMLYTPVSWLLWLHIVSFLANIALMLFWVWMLRARFREHASTDAESSAIQE